MNDYTWQFIIAIAAVTSALVFVFHLYVRRVEAEIARVWKLYENHTAELKGRVCFLEGEVTRLADQQTKILARAAGIDIDGEGDDGR